MLVVCRPPERSAARQRAELSMTVAQARLGELLSDFRAASPHNACQVARDASAELAQVARTLARVGTARPRRDVRGPV